MQELKNKGAPMHSLLFTKISVIPAGFEPTTHSLEGCCSIQLSYETITYCPYGLLRRKINSFISFIQMK